MKKKRLLIYFCISLALFTLIGVSFFYLRKLNALQEFNKKVDQSYQVIIKTDLLEKNLLNAEAGQRGYLLTKNTAFLESYISELKDIPAIFIKLDYLTSNNYPQQKNLDTLRDAINLQLGFLKSNISIDIEDTAIVTKLTEGHAYMSRVVQIINNIKDREHNLLKEGMQIKDNGTIDTRKGSFLSLTVAFALVCIAAILIIFFFNRNEIYRADLEDKLIKLTTLNNEIKELTLVSAHNLQEPMRKVQMIIDRVQHMAGVNDMALNEQLNRIKEIYSRQQLTNNNIVDYYTILLATEKKETIQLNEFLTRLQKRNNWEGQFRLVLDKLQPIEGDPIHMEILLKNIIDNSIRFKDPARPLEIRVHEVQNDKTIPGSKNKKYYGIAVSDNGTGIEPAYLSKIFGLFQKMDISGDKSQSGMGLSFCKRIMQNHNGWISAKQNAPYGVSILLFFPKEGKV